VELLVEEPLAVAFGTRTREEKSGTVFDLPSVGDAPGIGPEAGRAERELTAAVLRRISSHDVHDREEGARPVEGRAGAADDLDVVDEGDVELELAPDQGFGIDVVVRAVPVDQHEHAAVVIAGTAESPDAEIGVVPV